MRPAFPCLAYVFSRKALIKNNNLWHTGFVKKKIIILGAGVMQGPSIRAAKALGLETVVVDADVNAPHAPDADRFENIDLKDKKGVEKLARSIPKEELAGVMTAGTDFSATVAWVAERLGLAGIPYSAALNASDKERMRSCFKRAGVPSPAFMIVKKGDEKSKIAPDFPFPVVIKPVDNMGARGCRRADAFDELQDAIQDALRFSRSGRAIIEEYMDGPEFSIDALVYQGEITVTGLADRHIFFPPYFIEMGHTMPSALSPADAEKLIAAFKAGVRSLGIENGAAKGDIKLTPKGAMVGEIAARLSGGYMSGWTFPYASGVDLTKAAVQIAIGEKPAGLEPSRDWTSAERAFISIAGKVREIYGLEKAQNIPFVKNVFLRAGVGERVCFPVNNVSKAGNIITAAPNREDAVFAAESAARAILIRLESPDAETDAFLNNKDEKKFPPPAFDLPESLLEKLEKTPDGVEKLGEKEKSSGIDKDIGILVFPELENSAFLDWQGMTIEESLEAVRTVTGLKLSFVKEETGKYWGRGFWKALIRGGYQGAVYLLDTFFP
jgi:biotin carboxylase